MSLPSGAEKSQSVSAEMDANAEEVLGVTIDGEGSAPTKVRNGSVFGLSQDPIFGREQAVTSIPLLREGARQWVAIVIVSCLAAIVLLSFAVIFVSVLRGEATLAEAKDLIEIVVGPVTGIVGAVTGFYFGEKQSSE